MFSPGPQCKRARLMQTMETETLFPPNATDQERNDGQTTTTTTTSLAKDDGYDDTLSRGDDEEDEDTGSADDFYGDSDEDGCDFSADDMASDDDDMDMMADDEPSSAASAQARVECIPPIDMQEKIRSMVSQVRDVTSVSEDSAYALLHALRWDTEGIISSYFEAPERLLKKSGLTPQKKKLKSSSDDADTGDENECSVCCCSEQDGVELVPMMECGHVACKACWRSYVEDQIKQNVGLQMTCVGYGCQMAVPRSLVLAVAGSDDVKSRYDKLIMEDVILAQKNLKWCPTPNCETIVKSLASGLHPCGTVTCKRCDESFCFDCGEEHSPATCKMIKSFRTRVSAEGDDITWLTEHAKECPQCSAYIQKNGGCNWVQCARCRYEFCWLCGRQIAHREIDAAGGDHKCNVFKDGEQEQIKRRAQKKEQLAQEDDRKRFTHFFKRYKNHKDSAGMEAKLREKLDAQRADLTPEQLPLRDAQKAGLHRLRYARRALWNSYILAYYQEWEEGNSRKDIFEDLQHLLESRTEALSKAIEASLPDADSTKSLQELKADIMSRDDAVKVNLRNLVDACYNDLAVQQSSE